MINNIDTSLILLTYKGKILLLLRDNQQAIAEPNTWCFIGATKEKSESFKEAIFRKVEEETNLRLTSIEFVSILLYNEKRKYFYHTALTDKNVNDIKRGEGRELQFFTLKELEKLPLAMSARLFMERHPNLLSHENSGVGVTVGD